MNHVFHIYKLTVIISKIKANINEMKMLKRNKSWCMYTKLIILLKKTKQFTYTEVQHYKSAKSSTIKNLYWTVLTYIGKFVEKVWIIDKELQASKCILKCIFKSESKMFIYLSGYYMYVLLYSCKKSKESKLNLSCKRCLYNFTFRSIIISMQTHVKEPKSFNFNSNTCKSIKNG